MDTTDKSNIPQKPHTITDCFIKAIQAFNDVIAEHNAMARRAREQENIPDLDSDERHADVGFESCLDAWEPEREERDWEAEHGERM
jgi:hypothetical protein|tara:strand:+ start:8099 stop:8356 length:258 start_codon:yes stop_codon:yes gene_type:complete